MSAVKPKLASRRDQIDEPAVGQPLHARRPIDADHGRFVGIGGKSQPRGAQSCNGGAGILELMPPIQPWSRQVQEPVIVLIDEAAPLFRAVQSSPAILSGAR